MPPDEDTDVPVRFVCGTESDQREVFARALLLPVSANTRWHGRCMYFEVHVSCMLPVCCMYAACTLYVCCVHGVQYIHPELLARALLHIHAHLHGAICDIRIKHVHHIRNIDAIYHAHIGSIEWQH